MVGPNRYHRIFIEFVIFQCLHYLSYTPIHVADTSKLCPFNIAPLGRIHYFVDNIFSIDGWNIVHIIWRIFGYFDFIYIIQIEKLFWRRKFYMRGMKSNRQEKWLFMLFGQITGSACCRMAVAKFAGFAIERTPMQVVGKPASAFNRFKRF